MSENFLEFSFHGSRHRNRCSCCFWRSLSEGWSIECAISFLYHYLWWISLKLCCFLFNGILQLEYAALDAVVLLQIFHHVRSCSQPTDVSEGHDKIEWKSYIVSILTKINFIWKAILCYPSLSWQVHVLA